MREQQLNDTSKGKERSVFCLCLAPLFVSRAPVCVSRPCFSAYLAHPLSHLYA